MCARVQTDVLRVPIFQFCTCLWRRVFGVLRVVCVLLGLYVLYALCALYAFSKPYVQHRWPQKRACGQKRTDGRQRNMYKYPAPPPPRHGQFDRHVGYSPPTLQNFLQHCLYFSWGILCPLICYTADYVSAGMMTIGLGVW